MEKTEVEKKRNKVEEINTEIDEIDARGRRLIAQKNFDRLTSGEPQQPEDTLNSKIMDEVVIPGLNKMVTGSGGASEELKGVVKVLDKAIDKLDKQGEPKSAGLTINDVLDTVDKVKNLVKDDETKKEVDDLKEEIKELKDGKGKTDDLDTIDKIFDIMDKIEEKIKPRSGGDGGSSAALLEHRRWMAGFSRTSQMQDRAFNLRLRQQDKAHDLEIAKLGVQRERNQIFEDFTKTLGETVVDALVEEEDYEEERHPRRGRKKSDIWKGPCPECKTMITVPPEAQIVGKKIPCPNEECPTVFRWTDKLK